MNSFSHPSHQHKKETASIPLKICREVTIENEHGLHARPAALFVKAANRFVADIWVEKDGEEVNGKSIMGLMMLAAAKGSHLRLTAIGADATRLLDELEQLINSGFGEFSASGRNE